jgi:CysZ protein
MEQIIFAFKAYQRAILFSRANHLGAYYFFPALVSLVIFCVLSYFFYLFGAYLIDYVMSFLPQQTETSFWQNALQIILTGLVYLLLFLFYLKTYRYVVLILLSPALALLAEKVQEIDQNHPPKPFNLSQFMLDILRGIKISFRNLVVELLLTFILFGLGLLIGVISPFTTLAIIVIESYFLGFSMIDYRNEYHRISADESQKMIWKYKKFATSIGLVCNLLLFIPILGVLFAPLLAVVAAGLGINELENKQQK